MNNQFATQFLLEDQSELKDIISSTVQQAGATDEDLIRMLTDAVVNGIITLEKATEIIQGTTGVQEMSTVGGGSTAGAAFTPGAGEQMATTKAFKKKKYQEAAGADCIPVGELRKVVDIYARSSDMPAAQFYHMVRGLISKYGISEDAPRLAGDPRKTTSHGAKNLSAYSSVGFTAAPSAQEAGKKMKSIDVKMLWKEGEKEVEITWGQIEKLVRKVGKDEIGIPANLEGDYIQYMKDAFNQGLITNLQSLRTTAANFTELYREGVETVTEFESGDKVRILPSSGWIRPGANVTGVIHDTDGEDAFSVIVDAPGNPLKTIKAKDLEPLNESRAYSKFKREAATRTKDQQMHEAVKMIHEKLEEVSRLAEFAQQMRNELSEGENTLEYKHNTKKIFEKINSKVVEVYTKTRQLK